MGTNEQIDLAKKPGEISTKLHKFYKGKIETSIKTPIKNYSDFALWYTPGVASPCLEIKKDKDLSFEYTNRGNSIAVISDCSRVLGLGDIGPESGLPVMEGKAQLYKYLGGVDAFPIVLSTKNEDEIISACKWISPSFGGINLEDIEKPKCFTILDKLKGEINIPVWHDDQQGTATVILAALINALKVVNKDLKEVTIAIIGSGAAGTSTANLLEQVGADKKKIIFVDSKGILHPHREDLKKDFYKYKICMETNKEEKQGGISVALKDVDVCIALSTSGPGVIKKEWASDMADNAIMFACANPVPEIWPWDAKEAGVKVVATGRSDFPNQVNNSLVFPGIFRGALDVRATSITDNMCIAAAIAITEIAEEKGIDENRIMPSMENWEIFPKEATAVGLKAIEEKIARKVMSEEEIYQNAYTIIKRSRDSTELLMNNGLIKEMPEEE